MYTDISQNVTIFQGDSQCVTAGTWKRETLDLHRTACLTSCLHLEMTFTDYGVFPNGTVSVLNSARLKAPDGDLDQIRGWAQVCCALHELLHFAELINGIA